MNVNRGNFSFHSTAVLVFLIILTGCHPRSELLEPSLVYTPQKRQFESLPSAFDDLRLDEAKSDWGKELVLGRAFARELDYYRAITTLKRALFLLPRENTMRRMEVEFHIIQCYFLGKKYHEALQTFECGTIRTANSAFPAFRDLLVILYESYLKTDEIEKAGAILYLMEKGDPETAQNLKLFTALDVGDLSNIFAISRQHLHCKELTQFLNQYHRCSKSVKKAQMLNAVLPGAGYLYVGQKKSALTSLILNTSFIAATYYFFDTGNWGAGLFTASLEFGWYFGGINGAGLAAKEYNEHLYNELGKDTMIKQRLFPVLMFQVGF